MALPALDPHPFGCPICLAHTPAQMPEVITQLVLKIRDLLFPSVHVINPSRGQSYPILNLHVDEDDDRPRVVLFPGWEDNRGSARRRLHYGRQVTLLQRIHDAGVRGERMEDWRGEPLPGVQDEPLQLCLAVTADGMLDAARDLNEYLGDQLRVTLTQVPQEHGPDLVITRLYAPNREKNPRLVLFPAWRGVVENPSDRLERDDLAEILAWAEGANLRELPVEVL